MILEGVALVDSVVEIDDLRGEFGLDFGQGLLVTFIMSPLEDGLIFGEVLFHDILNAFALFWSLIQDSVFRIDDGQLFDLCEFSFNDGAHHGFKAIWADV